jgi:hypothetical protein
MQDCEKIVGFGIQGVIGSEKRRREADREGEQADQEMREVAVEVVDDEPKKSMAQRHKSILSQKVKISFMVNQEGFIAPGDALDQQTAGMMWEDSMLDKAAKAFLKVKDNGRYLPLDIVGHLDFFYNTLLLSHETSNPFNRPRVYQALMFPLLKGTKAKGETILDLHKRVTFPLYF